MLTRHGERNKPKSWSHRSCHLLQEPLRPHLHQLTGKDCVFTDPFSPHTSQRQSQKDLSTQQCEIRASYALRLWTIRACLTPGEMFGSFTVIISHKHERYDKRSLGFSLLHANWLARSQQTVRFSCARGRLERNQAINLYKKQVFYLFSSQPTGHIIKNISTIH